MFSGFECISDDVGKAVIKVEGAAKPISWTLKNSSGTQIATEGDVAKYELANYNDEFNTQNFTITLPNLPTDTYTFTFTDGNTCTETEEVKVIKPEEIDAKLLVDSVSTIGGGTGAGNNNSVSGSNLSTIVDDNANDVSKLELDCYGDSDGAITIIGNGCLLYTSPSPRDRQKSRMPSSA